MSLQAPPLELVRLYPDFYRWLLPRLNLIAQLFPDARPTSWYRTTARNFEVGGVPRSQHLLGWAVDFAVRGVQAQRMMTVGLALGLVAIDEGDHVHFQMFPAGVIPDRFFAPTFEV